ncbi:MAG: hypothetical protein AVDCRST_MAG88-4259, partial [uncultured Thermomicrobiales bacterium]
WGRACGDPWRTKGSNCRGSRSTRRGWSRRSCRAPMTAPCGCS